MPPTFVIFLSFVKKKEEKRKKSNENGVRIWIQSIINYLFINLLFQHSFCKTLKRNWITRFSTLLFELSVTFVNVLCELTLSERRTIEFWIRNNGKLVNYWNNKNPKVCVCMCVKKNDKLGTSSNLLALQFFAVSKICIRRQCLIDFIDTDQRSNLAAAVKISVPWL